MSLKSEFRTFTYCEAVQKAIQKKDSIKDKDAAFKAYIAAAQEKSNNEARDIAIDIVGEPVFWDCDRKPQLYNSLLPLNYFQFLGQGKVTITILAGLR